MDYSEFIITYPEHENTDQSKIERFLDLFVLMYGLGYGLLNDHLQGLYASHRLAISEQGATNTGEVASRSVGDVSTSYVTSNDSTDKSGMSATPYGVEFLDIISAFSSPMVAG